MLHLISLIQYVIYVCMKIPLKKLNDPNAMQNPLDFCFRKHDQVKIIRIFKECRKF